jgi:hypothetical protein
MGLMRDGASSFKTTPSRLHVRDLLSLEEDQAYLRAAFRFIRSRADLLERWPGVLEELRLRLEDDNVDDDSDAYDEGDAGSGDDDFRSSSSSSGEEVKLEEPPPKRRHQQEAQEFVVVDEEADAKDKNKAPSTFILSRNTRASRGWLDKKVVGCGDVWDTTRFGRIVFVGFFRHPPALYDLVALQRDGGSSFKPTPVPWHLRLRVKDLSTLVQDRELLANAINFLALHPHLQLKWPGALAEMQKRLESLSTPQAVEGR